MHAPPLQAAAHAYYYIWITFGCCFSLRTDASTGYNSAVQDPVLAKDKEAFKLLYLSSKGPYTCLARQLPMSCRLVCHTGRQWAMGSRQRTLYRDIPGKGRERVHRRIFSRQRSVMQRQCFANLTACGPNKSQISLFLSARLESHC